MHLIYVLCARHICNLFPSWQAAKNILQQTVKVQGKHTHAGLCCPPAVIKVHDVVRQVFATAGVSKRISIYEYSAIMANPAAETHCPSQELATRSKLSCLSWNKYLKTYLASSDYEGVVHVWDIATGHNVAEYEAHEKRIWSVDFCHVDPKLLMSGSDDGMVKVCTPSPPPRANRNPPASICPHHSAVTFSACNLDSSMLVA